MRIIDADELMEHVWRDKLDSRELIAEMIDNAPTVKEIPTNIPINIFEQLIQQQPKSEWEHDHEILKAYSDGVNAVLDTIRAEIEYEYLAEGHLPDYWSGIAKCLQIIDKYKAEEEAAEQNENDYRRV